MTITAKRVIIVIQNKTKKGDFVLLTKEKLEQLSKKIMKGMHNKLAGGASQYEYKFSADEIRLIQKLIDDAHTKLCNN